MIQRNNPEEKQLHEHQSNSKNIQASHEEIRIKIWTYRLFSVIFKCFDRHHRLQNVVCKSNFQGQDLSFNTLSEKRAAFDVLSVLFS